MAEPPAEEAETSAPEGPDRRVRELAAKPVVLRLPGMDEVVARSDLEYTSVEDPVLLMDVYAPPSVGGEERRPGVVFIHGNVPPGSPAKDMGVFRSWGRLAAASGMIGITFTHRLGVPKPLLREAADDVGAAIDYVRDNAASLNLDKDRVCLVAFSGGGPLLSVAMRDRPEYVRCLVSFYAYLDIRHAELYSGHEAPETLSSFSPINYLAGEDQEMAPMLIARAGLDGFPGINDSIDRFLRRALSGNAPITLVNHPRGVHGFDIQTDDERSREIIRSALAFMRTHLGATDSAAHSDE